MGGGRGGRRQRKINSHTVKAILKGTLKGTLTFLTNFKNKRIKKKKSNEKALTYDRSNAFASAVHYVNVKHSVSKRIKK